MKSSSANWFKSSYSGGDNACVECATLQPVSHAIAVRDSKDPARGTLHFTAAAWRTFLQEQANAPANK
ncbi:DUF397 domain-containing protein [Streptomyces sp. NPDC087440]|uniref:DUF397 domain-containing protein n=1 Tax=Streptomyces sp. NPDC087440 TaxID=3365790 RepID=UPI00380175AB